MAETQTITVEIAYGTAERQFLQTMQFSDGITARQAVRQSRLSEEFPEADLNAPLGIFGKTVPDDTVLRHRDRVEVYRPLLIDPKEARRRRVAAAQEQE